MNIYLFFAYPIEHGFYYLIGFLKCFNWNKNKLKTDTNAEVYHFVTNKILQFLEVCKHIEKCFKVKAVFLTFIYRS